ncbi:endo-1,4-beta-xylanase [Pontibacter korlensis]|uniref:Beta-xylanase n=1 Tax=Pontibacter korlensis TaxID=400092 RepID=A0A0E3UW00_9BACT|nr:endo-1,4-beta-xylanase [Pontibacter korlensis]AKD02271.1 1,4-beta-xylanase [Pontibacter korlensis]
MKSYKVLLASFLALASVLASCTDSQQGTSETATAEQTAADSSTALKDVFQQDFYVGAALNFQQASGKDSGATAVIAKHFNTISPENLLKWGPVHPEPDKYNFGPADDYVKLGQQHDMFVVGHTLVWHNQTPDWVFEVGKDNPASKEVLLQRMEDHISTVAGRYKGKIHGWDVVNEALNDDGTLRESKWLKIAGEEYLERAYRLAQQVDPEAELYYNDYNMWKPAKRDGAIRLVRNLQEKGVKVDGIGMQGHWGLENPSIEQIEESIVAFSKLGKVMITELDIDVLPNPSNRNGADIDATFDFDEKYNVYTEGLPDSVQQKLTKRYADIFALFYKHRDKISRVTFWGVTDANSWLNDWPIKGRTSYPLLFDRNYQPKPALEAVLNSKPKTSSTQ